PETRMSALEEAIEAARIAASSGPNPVNAREAVLRILEAAASDERVLANLKDVVAARALLRFTDTNEAIEFQAGDGKLHAEAADVKGKGPKVDATGATWLGLVSGTLRPWLAFTRGLVVARAGLTELRRRLLHVASRVQGEPPADCVARGRPRALHRDARRVRRARTRSRPWMGRRVRARRHRVTAGRRRRDDDLPAARRATPHRHDPRRREPRERRDRTRDLSVCGRGRRRWGLFAS